jgi:hypothetical protein
MGPPMLTAPLPDQFVVPALSIARSTRVSVVFVPVSMSRMAPAGIVVVPVPCIVPPVQSSVPATVRSPAPSRVPAIVLVLEPVTVVVPPPTRNVPAAETFNVPSVLLAELALSTVNVPPVTSMVSDESAVIVLTAAVTLTITVAPPEIVMSSLAPGTPWLLFESAQLAATPKSPEEPPTQWYAVSSRRSSSTSAAARKDLRRAILARSVEARCCVAISPPSAARRIRTIAHPPLRRETTRSRH